MTSVTLGHSAASASASARVILRQLLSPKPSARASVISFSPHQDGVPPVLAVSDSPSEVSGSLSPAPPVSAAGSSSALDGSLELELLLEPPHAARPRARTSTSKAAIPNFGLSLEFISSPSSRLRSSGGHLSWFASGSHLRE